MASGELGSNDKLLVSAGTQGRMSIWEGDLFNATETEVLPLVLSAVDLGPRC